MLIQTSTYLMANNYKYPSGNAGRTNNRNTMKYLSNYMEDRQTKAIDKAKAFFAFSDKQVEEGKAKQGLTDDIKLVSVGSGLICPKDTAKTLIKELDTIYKNSIKQDVEENTKDGVIKRELYNHEAFYCGEIEQTVDALQDYPLTVEDIQKIYQGETRARCEGKKEFLSR